MQLSNLFNRKNASNDQTDSSGQTSMNKQKKQQPLVRPPRWKSGLLILLSITLMVLALIARVLTTSDEEKLAELEKKVAKETVVDKKIQRENFREITTIDSIGNFDRQVKPVSFEDILLEKRSQHFEFKDAEFVVARKAAWTVQIMDVAEEDVIIDFLSTAEKRDQFAYFRYIAPDKSKRYILIFDDFNDKEGAEIAMADNEFMLPASVKPFARPFTDYVGTVDSYHLQRNVRDLKRSSQREVILRKSRAPVYTDSANSVPVTKRPNQKSRRQSSNRSKENAFGSQPKRQGRVVKPDVNPKPNIIRRDSTVIIEERSLSQPANKPAVSSPPSENNGQSDSLSNLIDRID